MPQEPADLTRLPDLTNPGGVGPVRARRPEYVDLLPPCNDALPGRREHPGLARPRAGAAAIEEAWRDDRARQPDAGRPRPRLLPPVRGRAATAPSSTRGVDPRRRAVPRRPRARAEGWTLGALPAATGRRVLVVGAGPSGLSAAYHLRLLGPRGRDPRRRPGGGRHDALRHPRLPPAARQCSTAEIARIEALGVKIILDHKVADLIAEKRGGRVRRRLRRRRRAPGQARRHPRARRRQDRRRRGVPAQRRAGASGRSSAAASPSTAAATRRWTRRACRAGWGRPSRSSSTGARASRCPPTPSRPTTPIDEGVKIHWLRTIAEVDGPDAQGRGHGARRQGPAAADRALRDARGRHGDPRARPGHRHRVPARGPRRRDRPTDGVVAVSERS